MKKSESLEFVGIDSSAGDVFFVYISVLVDISTCSDANSLAIHESI